MLPAFGPVLLLLLLLFSFSFVGNRIGIKEWSLSFVLIAFHIFFKALLVHSALLAGSSSG